MNSAIRSIASICALFPSVTMAAAAGAEEPAPSRPPIDNCGCEKPADKTIGLGAWVQRCDLGFRQIHFGHFGNALAIKYSGRGAAEMPDGIRCFEVLAGGGAEGAVRPHRPG
ncbi:hypothetical protein NKJ36_09800 [Mesorhizobium sp. M0142]|uniref:hypothetical protein n=1 Tax=unclassified Mesorhizobium TaxID=325217 RepID=UPI003336B1A5